MGICVPLNPLPPVSISAVCRTFYYLESVAPWNKSSWPILELSRHGRNPHASVMNREDFFHGAMDLGFFSSIVASECDRFHMKGLEA